MFPSVARSHWLKSRHQRGCAPPGGPRGESVFWCFLPAFLGSLASSLHLERHCIPLTLPPWSQLPLCPKRKAALLLRTQTGPIWIIQNNYCISGPLITSEKPLMSGKVMCSQVLGIGIWTSFSRGRAVVYILTLPSNEIAAAGSGQLFGCLGACRCIAARC